MPGVILGSIEWRDLERRVAAEGGVVAERDFLPPLAHAVDSRELRDPERRRDVGHVVFETRRNDLVVPRPLRAVAVPDVLADAVQRHHPAARGPGAVIGAAHSSLAGGD